jgi:hypothetical protein
MFEEFSLLLPLFWVKCLIQFEVSFLCFILFVLYTLDSSEINLNHLYFVKDHEDFLISFKIHISYPSS